MSDQVTISPHVTIPTRDGTRLSAAIHWPPESKVAGLFPALIEYHPYRKDDKSAARAADHDYFAQHGFASVRLDVRGTGSSEDINTDEYMQIETQDGYDAVEWLASQEWCNGNVGMFGSSYGGFTSYQVAMLQPSSLKAIVPIYATDDRYTDDCHYKGGALKGYYDVATYGTMMAAMNALPPDPERFGDGWEEEWQSRIDDYEPYMEKWLSNHRDGDYWRPGSLRGQYEKLKAATFIIGGWQDGYPNPPLRAFHNIKCSRKILVGPWNHSRPDVAIPGPRIDYLREMRRWFDLHLKGIDDGISDEPPVTFFVQQFDAPLETRTETTGKWHSQRDWPVANSGERIFYLGNPEPTGGHRMADKPVVSERVSSLRSDPSVGIMGGLWSGGLPFGLPGDQRRDEALSLTYTSMPLQEDLTIAGHPVIEFTAASDKPTALFVAKLADVAPDGSSALVCKGVLNGTRRNGLSGEPPEPLEPHEMYRLRIKLDATAWKFERGHRIRLAICGSDFPNMWPAPGNTTINVSTGGAEQSTLTLPVLVGEDVASPEFLPSPKELPGFGDSVWETTFSPFSESVFLNVSRGGKSEVRDGVEIESSDSIHFVADRADSSKVTADGKHVTKLRHGDTEFESTAFQAIKSDAENFHWSLQVVVTKDDERVMDRKWERSFPRDLM